METTCPISLAAAAVGGQATLAKAIGVTPALISQWKNRVRPVAPAQCPAIEQATGIRCEQIRPDVRWLRGNDGAVHGYVVLIHEGAATGDFESKASNSADRFIVNE